MGYASVIGGNGEARSFNLQNGRASVLWIWKDCQPVEAVDIAGSDPIVQ